ncbi:MAG: T9SS type A sorting domain-containing protein, partial [FCB group bacterium]|nr:T9SS type A sorting domain-containing protein [FCB group bacterium]
LLKVFDVQGREVTTLVNGWMNAGNHQAVFNAQLLPSGVYFVRLTVNREPGTENREKQTAVKKVMLVK